MITYPLKSLHPTWPYITDVSDLEALGNYDYTGPVLMPIGVYTQQSRYTEALLPLNIALHRQYPAGALLTVKGRVCHELHA